MLRKLFAGVGVSSFLVAAPLSAGAADMPVKAPPLAPAPAYSWTGCYLDAGAGYGMWNQDHYNEIGPPASATFVPFTVTQTAGGRGWLGRFGGGCDYQLGSMLGHSLVVGAFADYDTKSLTGEWSDAVGIAGNETENSSWAGGARIGLAVTPGTLAYVDGGYTQARFGAFGLVTGVGGVPLPFTQAAQTYDGFFLGGGTETALSSWFGGLPSNLFLRTEYRYSSYGSQDVPWIFTPTGALSGDYEHSTKYEQSITTSLVWRFNATAAAWSAPASPYLPLKAPSAPPPAAVNWSGCYVDAGAGYELWNQDHYFEAGPPVVTGFIPLSVTQTAGGRGWLGRFGGGCDYQTSLFNNRLVIGAFADYDTKSITGVWSDASGFAGNETETRSWAAGPRVGFALTPATLAFADGGYTQSQFGAFGLVTGVGGIALPFTEVAQNYDGWFLGGGTETSLSSWLGGLPSGLFLRTEYRYASYGAQDVPIIFNPTGALTGAYEHTTNYEQSITTSLVWKFNWMAH